MMIVYLCFPIFWFFSAGVTFLKRNGGYIIPIALLQAVMVSLFVVTMSPNLSILGMVGGF
jgi:hypothetical protein